MGHKQQDIYLYRCSYSERFMKAWLTQWFVLGPMTVSGSHCCSSTPDTKPWNSGDSIPGEEDSVRPGTLLPEGEWKGWTCSSTQYILAFCPTHSLIGVEDPGLCQRRKFNLLSLQIQMLTSFWKVPPAVWVSPHSVWLTQKINSPIYIFGLLRELNIEELIRHCLSHFVIRAKYQTVAI